MSAVVLALPWKNVARVDSFVHGSPSGARKVELTLMSPASFDEQGGYAPAESVSVTLFQGDVFALIEALRGALNPNEVTP